MTHFTRSAERRPDGVSVHCVAAISSFTLLDVCGAASFRLSVDELSAWLFTFGAMYPVYVLDVHGVRTNDCEA